MLAHQGMAPLKGLHAEEATVQLALGHRPPFKRPIGADLKEASSSFQLLSSNSYSSTFPSFLFPVFVSLAFQGAGDTGADECSAF